MKAQSVRGKIVELIMNVKKYMVNIVGKGVEKRMNHIVIDPIEVIDEHIEKHQRMADSAYERAWFKEMEQELAIVNALNELKKEVK